ncbi:hypothetical protein [Flavobacterium sp. TR2]|nr:hypothetical protein [Flavobacterium sp. TR2]UWY26318.1 hypothetical protein N4T20_11405 [Flavobacterium sp. TR2]
MEDIAVLLNGFDGFDGIVDKISVEYNSKNIQLAIKQWSYGETHNL